MKIINKQIIRLKSVCVDGMNSLVSDIHNFFLLSTTLLYYHMYF